jgi:cytochrome c oxidase subunit 3
MSMVTTTSQEHHGEDHNHEPSWSVQLQSNRLGMWLFMFSEVFLFGALLTARFILWGQYRPRLSQEIGLVATVILLFSSWFVYRGQTAIEFGDRKAFQRNFLLAAIFGTLFLIGVVFFEWNIFGLSASIGPIELFGHLKPSDGVESGIFFAMTGWHALHVVTGVMLLLIMWNKGRRGEFTPGRSWGVEGAGLYWHFVDVVWVFYYPALYLMGLPM